MNFFSSRLTFIYLEADQKAWLRTFGLRMEDVDTSSRAVPWENNMFVLLYELGRRTHNSL